MPCGAILYFDDETDAAIRGLWQAIDDAGLPSTSLGLNYPPHMTLMVCDDLDLDGLRRTLPQFIAVHTPLLVRFAGLGVFPGKEVTIYQSLTWNRELLDLHARFWQVADPYVQQSDEHYRPGAWVPHVTLDYALAPDQVGGVVETLLQNSLPSYGLLRELVLVDFQPEESKLEERFKTRLGRYL